MDGIDFVILWVDDSDREWIKEKNKYFQMNNTTSEQKAMAAEKAYRDWGNLIYWFRGIEKYAPWVRKVHFVTCGHVPDWLNIEHEKLNIVKHSEFMPESSLPTFNSRAIEVNLHKISNLSERFVYFNDDMFLNDHVREEDFFINYFPKELGILSPIIPLQHGTASVQVNDLEIVNKYFSLKKSKKNLIKKLIHVGYGKENIRNVFLMNSTHFPGFFEPHLPNPYLKKTFSELWEKENEILTNTSISKFKNKYNVNQWLFRYWQLASGNFVPQTIKFGKYYELSENNELIYADILKNKHKLICLNDSFALESFTKIKTELINVFSEKFPEKSRFEK